MNGRMYDPITKQMTSPDIFDQSTYFTQSYNRYTYALNNPMRFTDPSGYDWRLVGWAYSYQTDMDGNFESETWYPVKEWETKAYWEAGLNDNGRSIGGGFNGGFGGGGGSANYAGDVNYGSPDNATFTYHGEKLKITDPQFVNKIYNEMIRIYKHNGKGNITNLIDFNSINFSGYDDDISRTFDYKIDNIWISITIYDPNNVRDTDYYQVSVDDYSTFGRASWGMISISNQFSLLSIKFTNQSYFNKVFNMIFN